MQSFQLLGNHPKGKVQIFLLDDQNLIKKFHQHLKKKEQKITYKGKVFMSTQKETVEFILEKLGEPKRFAVRAMFGEYALYCGGKVVGLVCNNQLYVKILPASAELEDVCDKDEAYPGSKLYYVVEEVQLSQLPNLIEILINIAKSLPAKKPKSRPKADGRGGK